MAATERGHDGVNVNGETLSVFEGHGAALAKRMPTCYVIAMKMSAKDILARVENWPVEDQDELAQVAREIEARRTGIYRATPEELRAIDEAESSGIASDADVEAAFRSFRPA